MHESAQAIEGTGREIDEAPRVRKSRSSVTPCQQLKVLKMLVENPEGDLIGLLRKYKIPGAVDRRDLLLALNEAEKNGKLTISQIACLNELKRQMGVTAHRIRETIEIEGGTLNGPRQFFDRKIRPGHLRRDEMRNQI